MSDAARDWICVAAQLLAKGEQLVLVTQCSVEGSAPREPGAKMVVTHQSAFGSIGGGNLERLAIDQARKLLSHPQKTFLMQDHPLGPLLSQCCGGHVRILIERLSKEDVEWLDVLSSVQAAASNLVLETRLSDGFPHKLVRERRSGERGLRLADDAGFFDADGQRLIGARPMIEDCCYMVEPIPTKSPTLFLYGAGHVGQAVVRVLEVSAFQTRWFDERADFQTTIGVTRVESPPETGILDDAPEDVFVLIMTHSHDRDYELTRAALASDKPVYCGLIGSATKRARFLKRLRDDDLSEQQISKLTCPIGDVSLRGKTPGVIAVSAVAQLMAVLEGWQQDQFVAG